jgi:hypothetical protein
VAYRTGPHDRVVLRWSCRVVFNSTMSKRDVELRITERQWTRWTGRLYRAEVLGQLFR